MTVLTTISMSAAAADSSAAGSPANGDTALPTPVTTVEGITEYHLPNGLRVLLFPDPTKPTVLVNVTYLVGSRHEGYGETGMAHLLEHMLFKGTPTRPDIWKELQSKGANFNGSTWWDRTNYYEELPASPEALDFALALEADRMVNSKIAAEDLAKEFSVVRNEFEMGENQPQGVLEDKMMAVAYQWHNYGKSTIGSRSDIERVPVENLRGFYKKFYQPDNAVLIVAGQFDSKQALTLVSKYFGVIPRPARKLSPTWTVEPVQDGERQVILRRTGDVAVVSVIYHGVAGADPDRAAEDAIADVLTNKPSGRLYKALVEKGLASEVSGAVYPMAEPGVINITAKVRPGGSPEKVRDVMLSIVEEMGKKPVTSSELERWRAGWMKDFDLILTETAHTGVVLSEYAAMGDWRLLFLTRDRVKKVTTADVDRVAKAYLKPSNRTLGLFLPTKNPDRAPLATTPDVAAMMKDYKGEAALAEGEAFVATVDSVEKRTTRSSLPDGLKLALLPKKTKGGVVRLVLTIRFGSEADIKGKTEAASLLPDMLMRGTKKHTFEQIRDRLDQLRAEVSMGGGGFSPGTANLAQVRVKTTRDNLPAVLDLVTEILREPTFRAAELESLRKETLSHLEEQLQDPRANGQVAMLQQLFPYPPDDVRHIPTIQETIDHVHKIQVADLSHLHKTLWGAGAAQLAVVGDFDVDAIKAQLSKDLGTWKASKPYARITLPYKPNLREDRVIDTPEKEMSFVMTGATLEVRDDDPAYPALSMLNYMLGGSPSSRLFNRLRQKEGISYGAGSTIYAHPIDKSGRFMTWAICAPQNVDKGLASMLDELNKVLKDGFTDQELSEAKKSYAKNWEARLADDDFISGELAQELFLDRTMEYWRTLNDKIQKLTTAEITDTARRFIKVDQLAKVRAGDQKKKQ